MSEIPYAKRPAPGDAIVDHSAQAGAFLPQHSTAYTAIIFSGKLDLLDRAVCGYAPGHSHAIEVPEKGQFSVNDHITAAGRLPPASLPLQGKGGNLLEPLRRRRPPGSRTWAAW
jgi:hypothetical protein